MTPDYHQHRHRHHHHRHHSNRCRKYEGTEVLRVLVVTMEGIYRTRFDFWGIKYKPQVRRSGEWRFRHRYSERGCHIVPVLNERIAGFGSHKNESHLK